MLSQASGLRLGAAALRGALPWQALTAALLLAALVLGVLVSVPDVTWLIYAGEKLLDGHRLYADVLEVNPPLSVLAYVPAIGIARLVGAPPEAVVAGLVVLGAVGSLTLAGAILKPLIGQDLVRGWMLAATGAFVLGVLPAAAFGEREHLAVICLLPFLCLCMARAEGVRAAAALAVLAGVGLGLAVCLKPHVAAAAGLPALWAMRRTARFAPWRQAELLTGALVMVAYAALILLAFPDYLNRVAPVVRDVYLPIRAPLWQLLVLPGVPLAVGSVAVARVMRLERRWLAAPLMAAVGGAIAFAVQAKGFPYHAYPMLAFTALGVLGAAAMTPPSRARAWSRLDRLMLLAPPVAAMLWLFSNIDSDALARQVRALGPSPRLIAVTGNLGIGMAVARAAGADWVGSQCSQWISEGVLRREEAEPLGAGERARLDGLLAEDRSRLAGDIMRGRPQVVLFDRKKFDWRAWALHDPVIAGAMKGYRLTATVKGVEVWAANRPA